MKSVAVEGESLRVETSYGMVPLGYAAEGSEIYLVARERSVRWPVELLRSGRAAISLPSRHAVGIPELIIDPAERERVLDLFRQKYGPEAFAKWYEHPSRILRISLAEPATFSQTQSPPAGGYYGWLSAEFDNVAEDYDRHIFGNRMNRLLRDRSLEQLRSAFARSKRLLEIGCGSGVETLPLLDEGHEIHCVDISARMLEVVRAKAKRSGASERLSTERISAAELPKLVDEFGPGAFDGAYSTYGALNCEVDLRPIPPALHQLVRPDGRFITAVYNRWCAFELVGYALTGQFRRAFGRARQPVLVGSSRFCVDVYAHSVPEFERLFAPWFHTERVAGVPVMLPPSDLVSYAERFSGRFPQLDRWDRALGTVWPVSCLGDHFLMNLLRVERGGSAESEPRLAPSHRSNRDTSLRADGLQEPPPRAPAS